MSRIKKNDQLKPTHPGEILLEEFLRPMDISLDQFAEDINVDSRQINEIVHGQRAITADTAFRLGSYFGMTPEFWMNLQTHCDLERLRIESGKAIQREVKARA
jgi:antitoxin HigA-1